METVCRLNRAVKIDYVHQRVEVEDVFKLPAPAPVNPIAIGRGGELRGGQDTARKRRIVINVRDETVKIHPEAACDNLALVAANNAVKNGGKLRCKGVFATPAVAMAVKGAGQRPAQMIVHFGFPVLVGI